MRVVYFSMLLLLLACGAVTCIKKEKSDLKNGPVRSYHKNGRLAAEINYRNGRVHGLVRNWYDNGQLHDSAYFENGEPVGYSVSYYKNGKKNYENYWNKEHKLDSISRFWYDNGTIGSEGHYFDGVFHGEWRMYHRNGQLESIINYHGGEKEGQSIYFNEHGDTLRIEVYEGGKLVEST